MADIWSHGNAYEHFMGRWSRLVAPRFVRWLRARPGCGGSTSAAAAGR